MRLIVYATGVGIALAHAGFSAAAAADSVLCRTSLYRAPRAALLDRLFGPAEDFEYTGATTPFEPPAVS